MVVKTNRVVEETGIGQDGRPIQMLRIEFMVDQHGPFLLRFAKQGFNAQAARLQMDQFAREIGQLAQ